jgi:hypothetical protein
LPDRNARVSINDEKLQHNFGDWHAIETWHGSLATVLKDTYYMGMHGPRTSELFSIRYYVARAPHPPWTKEIAKLSSGARIYETPGGVLPRAWTVHSVSPVHSIEEARRWIEDPSQDFRTTAVVMGRAPLVDRCPEPDAVTASTRGLDHVEASVHMGCRGLVVFGEAFYPGWRALIDGNPAPILQVNGNLRGVVVGAGTHRIEMAYRPWTVYTGLALTLAGLAAAVAVGRFDKSSQT